MRKRCSSHLKPALYARCSRRTPTEQRERESDAERLGGLEVDVELDLCGLQDRQIGWFFALENSAGVAAGQAVAIRNVASVTHQATGGDERSILIDRRHRMADRQ